MRSFILTLVIITGAASAAAAQEDGPARGNRGRAAGGLTPADVADMLDAYALIQAQTQLQLRDAQFADFVTRLKAVQQTRRRNVQARNQMLRELHRMVGPQAKGAVDEHLVREKLKSLREHDARAAADLRRAYEGLDEVLDARQQARFRLFEEQLERRKLDLLMRARQGAARGQAPAPR